MKVIVTGGSGFIGSHIVDALADRGFEVHSIDVNQPDIRRNKKALYHNADIRQFDAIAPIVQDATYVFHCAALPRVQYSIEYPMETHDININGTLSVLEAARNGGVKRVIYSASSSAYGNQETMPLREDMPANPISPYGLQKYVGELKCRVWSEVYGLPTVSLRYFNVYGPRASHEGAYALVIAKFLHQRSRGEPMTITGSGEQTRDYTHVRDVVAANLLAAESDSVGKGEVLNIGAGSNASVNRIAELIGGPVEHIPPRLEPMHTLADNSRARSLLLWRPSVTLENGITELKTLYSLA